MKNTTHTLRGIATAMAVAISAIHVASAASESVNITVGSTSRNMIIYTPSGFETNRPLVISLHGLNQNAAYQQSEAEFDPIANTERFAVVYPNGINSSWDLSGTSDTNFISAIIDYMANRYGTDRNRVYLSGFSMGGMMTYYAATRIADRIAAFAPISGYLLGGPNTNSSRPIPIIHTHGTADDVVSYNGVQNTINAWVQRNACPTTAQVTDPYPSSNPNSICTRYSYGPGTNGVSVVLMRLEGKGHWISNDPANGIHTSQEIWNFCKNYSLGGGGIANGTYRINARHSGKAMDAYNAQTANGTQIIQWTYGGGNNQRWTVTNRGNNQYSIIGVQSGRAVDVNNSGTSNGTVVALFDYFGGNNQKFTFTATSGGYYRITPVHASGSCLDVAGVSTADGANVHLWQWLNANNQQWNLQTP